MPRALISVSDKTGIDAFASKLHGLGWQIISTGGTARKISEAGIPVTTVDQITGFPEIMDGRVKTLHPAVHGALLARRDDAGHMAALEEHGFETIDLVAVNLYPFRETIARPDVTMEQAVEQIDIGGPSMLRSAAKNHRSVFVVVDPADYAEVLAAISAGEAANELKERLAAKVFSHTASYDAAIAEYLDRGDGLPEQLTISLPRRQSLRYGENPAQKAALYAIDGAPGVGSIKQLHGKELSYNNLLDLDGALLSIAPFSGQTACAVIKHTTPCGIAVGTTAEEAFNRARATDPTSAFGSVVSFSVPVDKATAEAMSDLFVECVVAPSIAPDAVEVFQRKKNIRVVEYPNPPAAGALEVRTIAGGILAQDRFSYDGDEVSWKVATRRQPSDQEWADMRFGWAAVASVKSNAILLARDGAAIGIGAGQMSRVDASFLAVYKARNAGHSTDGCSLASDAFFPFPDGVEEAARAGITAIIQPGGSVRDEEVIAAADKLELAMVMTGARQFRH